MTPVEEFPRTDLPPQRHRRLRTALVAEAGRDAGPVAGRRFAPAVAALAVACLAGGFALAGTGPGRAIAAGLGAAVDRVVDGRSSDAGGPACGQTRSPAAADLQPVLYLPAATATTTTASATTSETSRCVAPLDASEPTPADTGYVRPVWALARVTTDREVLATATLWRSLPPGVSRDVADRTAPTPTPSADSIIPADHERVTVRGGDATLVRGADPAVGDAGLAVVWTASDGQVWSLSGRGVGRDELLSIADEVVINRGEARPADGILAYAGLVTAVLDEPVWVRLDIAEDLLPAPVTRAQTRRTPALQARLTGPGGLAAGLTVTAGAGLPWPADLDLGARLVDVGGRPAALTSLGEEVLLRVRLGSGADAVVKGGPAELVSDLVASLVEVPPTDPRLTPAS